MVETPANSSGDFLVLLFSLSQIAYLLSLSLNLYFRALPTNFVDMRGARNLRRHEYPYIVLFYPVLNELEETMRTTLLSVADLDYPKDRYRVVAIPNKNDLDTVAILQRLTKEFAFLEIIEVPLTTDPSWQVVWDRWEQNTKAYWWHQGARARVRDLPPKKTRQLIYSFYQVEKELSSKEDFLVNYIDADSCVPRDHFLAAAIGIKDFDVLQAQNIAGNLNKNMATSWHAADHMAWDGFIYPHLSANGRQPFWVLGKGLFFKASDLVELGGFHPWITIEDPEVGMRFWTNGKRLGIIEAPLIEEVPATIWRGIIQRKRWVCGFFQSLSSPLRSMGMTRWERFKAWLNFFPCLSLSFNSIGIPIGLWILWIGLGENDILPNWILGVAFFNLLAFAWLLASLYQSVWKRSALVLETGSARLRYLLRINPLSLMIWWIIWLVPLWIGYRMYVQDEGLVWERTEKTDANRELILKKKRFLENELLSS